MRTLMLRYVGGLAVVLVLMGCTGTLASSSEASISAPLELQQAQQDHDEREATQAKVLLVRGMTQAYVENYEAAMRFYEEALRITPHNAAVLSAAAEALEALGDLTTAVYYAEQARANAPDNRYYHEQLAHLNLSAGDADKAAETYEELLKRFPDDLDGFYELARIYTVSGRYERAVDTYDRILQKIGDDGDVLRRKLALELQRGDDDAAEKTLEALIDLDPDDGAARRSLAELYVRRGDSTAAVQRFEEALEREPGDVETALALSKLYEALGRDADAQRLLDQSMAAPGATADQLVVQATPLYTRAEADSTAAAAADRLLSRALELEPDNAEALVMLGQIRMQQDRYADAGALLYRALQKNPRDPQLWYRAAGAFLQGGDAGRAADVADEGLLLFPGQVYLLRVSGMAHMAAYHNDRAIARFQEALEVLKEDKPDDVAQRGDILGALGLLYQRKKDYAASDSAYERAVTADRDNALALNNYAFSLADRGVHLDRALVLARRAVDLAPEVSGYMDTLGWVYFKQQKLKEAAAWLVRAIENGDASAAVYEHYGDVLHRQGRPTEARTYWQKALERNPESESLRKKLNM